MINPFSKERMATSNEKLYWRDFHIKLLWVILTLEIDIFPYDFHSSFYSALILIVSSTL